MTHARNMPILPLLSSTTRWQVLGKKTTSILDVGTPILLDRGASAIRLALEHACIGAGDEVLVPAFHCPSMVWPIQSLGAIPTFYGIGADLRVVPQSVTERLSRRARAVLVPHLFGGLQNLSPIRAICDERNLVLIEDCAHAFFGSEYGLPIGSLGDYAVASPRKFFPLGEGGLLTSGRCALRQLEPSLGTSTGQLRIAYEMLDSAVSHGRMTWAARVVKLAQEVGQRFRAPQEATEGSANLVNRSGTACAPRRACTLTKCFLSAISFQNVWELRWRNYKRLACDFIRAPGVRVLEVDIPSDGAPYMVPLVLRRPKEQFAMLKKAGVPIWRWEHSRRGICDVTDSYAEALIQLPCHQDLTATELNHISLAVQGL